MKYLAAPWRWKFISGVKDMKGCIFCHALQQPQADSLVCHRGDKFFVILNKYPYTSGHLMIAPLAHLSSPDQLPAAETVEMWELLQLSMAVLSQRFHPDGFNIGMNVGQAAGAGIKDHFHLHVVPRWQGDANFLPVVGHTKLVSYDIAEMAHMVREGFRQKLSHT